MKLLVCGSRTIKNFDYVANCLELVIREHGVPEEIVEGEAQGVDKMSRIWAEMKGIPVTPMPADWKMYGRGAGLIRNAEMVVYCDNGVAIWDGVSTGTLHTITLLKEQNKLLKVFKNVINRLE